MPCFHSLLPAGCCPAAGVCHHPEGRERSDSHGHHHGHLLPDLLGPLCQCGVLHLHQPGVGLRAHLHDHPSFLCQELGHLQPCHLHRHEQTGNWQGARQLLFCVSLYNSWQRVTASQGASGLQRDLVPGDLVLAQGKGTVQLILGVAQISKMQDHST